MKMLHALLLITLLYATVHYTTLRYATLLLITFSFEFNPQAAMYSSINVSMKLTFHL